MLLAIFASLQDILLAGATILTRIRKVKPSQKPIVKPCIYSSMDRISDSGSEDGGSSPFRCTIQKG